MQSINATNRACLQKRRVEDDVNAVETATPRRCERRDGDGAAAKDGVTLLAIANLCQGRSPWSIVYGHLWSLGHGGWWSVVAGGGGWSWSVASEWR